MSFARAYLTATDTVTTEEAISWDAVRGALSAWAGGNPTRLTVPAGVTHVRLTGSLHGNTASFATRNTLKIHKNGAAMSPLPRQTYDYNSNTNGWTNRAFTLQSYIVPVVENDYFELLATASSTWDVTTSRSFFEMETISDFQGVLLKKTSQQTGLDLTSAYVSVSWDAEEYDTDGFWTSGTDIVVPAGYSYAQCIFNIELEPIVDSASRGVSIRKNGASIVNFVKSRGTTGSFAQDQQIVSPIVPVSQGDTLDAQVIVADSDSDQINTTSSFFGARFWSS